MIFTVLICSFCSFSYATEKDTSAFYCDEGVLVHETLGLIMVSNSVSMKECNKVASRMNFKIQPIVKEAANLEVLCNQKLRVFYNHCAKTLDRVVEGDSYERAFSMFPD